MFTSCTAARPQLSASSTRYWRTYFSSLMLKCKRALLEFSSKQPKVMFTFTGTDQNTLCVSSKSNKHVKCIYFLIKHLWSRFFYFLFCTVFKIQHCLHHCLLVCSLILPCLCCNTYSILSLQLPSEQVSIFVLMSLHVT